MFSQFLVMMKFFTSILDHPYLYLLPDGVAMIKFP